MRVSDADELDDRAGDGRPLLLCVSSTGRATLLHARRQTTIRRRHLRRRVPLQSAQVTTTRADRVD